MANVLSYRSLHTSTSPELHITVPSDWLLDRSSAAGYSYRRSEYCAMYTQWQVLSSSGVWAVLSPSPVPTVTQNLALWSKNQVSFPPFSPTSRHDHTIASATDFAGGDYTYLNAGFGNFVSFLFLWACTFMIQPGNRAIVALTFATYILKPFFPSCEPPQYAIVLLAAFVISKLSPPSITILLIMLVHQYATCRHLANVAKLNNHQLTSCNII